MSTQNYFGSTHTFTSRNKENNITLKSGVGENLTIQSLNLSVDGNYTVSTAGTVFSSSLYTSSTSQTINAATAIVKNFTAEFNTLTSVAYDSGTGIFTNNSGSIIRLQVNYSVASSFQSGERSAYILTSDATKFFANSTLNIAISNLVNLTGSTIIQLGVGSTFALYFRSSTSTNISANATDQLTSLSIMRLP